MHAVHALIAHGHRQGVSIRIPTAVLAETVRGTASHDAASIVRTADSDDLDLLLAGQPAVGVDRI